MSGIAMPDAESSMPALPATTTMASRRTLKAAAAIREVVSMAILAEIKDPRVKDVTVTQVEVAGDMRSAKVHVSVMGDETKQKLSLRGLQSSAGFLQAKIASRIDTRYTPRLEFVLDQGVKRSIEVARILHEVLPTQPDSGGEQAEGETRPEDEEQGDEQQGSEPSGEADDQEGSSDPA